jgi:hypothetical protein
MITIKYDDKPYKQYNNAYLQLPLYTFNLRFLSTDMTIV